MMKFLPALAALCAGAAIFLGPAPARADSILHFLLPSVFADPDAGPQPEDTLQAPFGKDIPPPPRTKTQAGLMSMYDAEQALNKTTGLDQPHRNAEQIGEWLTNVVTQSLTIDPLTYDPAKPPLNFTAFSQRQLQTYLSANQIPDSLKSRNMKLTAFAENKPVLVQEGALEGHYRWLFRVPVMLTYYTRDTASLKGIQGQPARTQRVIVNIQLGRVPPASMPEGMVIESWSITPG